MIKLTALLSVIAFTSSSVITQTEDCVYEADFRLLFESDSRIVGYVEYCFNHTWRGVCRDSLSAWEVEEAVVACRQLGYSDQRQGVTAGANCSRPNVTHYVRLNCEDGTESNLQECGVMAVDDCSCPTNTDFNVYSRLVCIKNCKDKETRLVGGSTDREGRVEVCVDGRWGTVQTNQPREMAHLVCHNHSDSLTLGFYSTSSCLVSQFGYSTSKPVYSCSLEGSNGNSTLSCTNTSSNNHSTDLGVLCQPPPDPTQEGVPCSVSNGTFRLTNGLLNREGRVEVCVDGRWGTVCNTDQEGIAGAVCSQLGFPSDGAVITTPVANDWARSYSCVVGGSEAGVNCTETCCDHPTSLTVKCLTHQEVVMREDFCSGTQEGHFRIVNDSVAVPNEGILEVCEDGHWRAVCNGSKEVSEAACSQLGFPSEDSRAVAIPATIEHSVSCDDRVGSCLCNHTFITCLTHKQLYERDCSTVQENRLRLVNGTTYSEGRVEVCKNGSWRSVCDNGQNYTICSALRISENDSEAGTSMGNDMSCCFTNKTVTDMNTTEHNSTTGTMYQMCQQVIYQIVREIIDEYIIPDPSSLPPSTSQTTPHSHNQSSNSSACTVSESVTVTSFSAVLAALVAATLISWTVTGVVVCRRGSTAVTKQSPEGPSLQRNESYCLTQPVEQVYDDATPTQFNYSSLGPNYDMIASSREGLLDTYDSIDHNQQNTNTPQDQPASPTPVRDEASKKEDDFFNAEQHIYAAVDISKKKKEKEIAHSVEDSDTTEAISTPGDKTASPTPVRDEASKKSNDFYDVEEHTYAAVSVQGKKKARRSEPDEREETEP